MLKRKIYQDLLAWKSRENKKCLIISGPRQIGKTFIVEQFAQREYERFININFLLNSSAHSIFESNLDAYTIRTNLTLYMGVRIEPKKTLLFLDEIQECPNAITALKFLLKDKDIDIIASGSALGIAYKNVNSFPVGSVEYLDMYSLSFEEFLMANHVGQDVFDVLKNCFEKREKVPLAIHEKMMEYLRMYLVIGGMPEVVQTFIDNKDYAQVDYIQKRLYRDYRMDIAHYADAGIKMKAEQCYTSIPIQLQKENHKFQYSVIEKKGTARKFESSVDWLLRAGIACAAYNVSDISFPLKQFINRDHFRLYMTDIGLLVGTYDMHIKSALLEEDDNNVILKTAKGGLYEALAADFLIKKGYQDLFFYRNQNGSIEMEFLLESSKGILPIEIKAGRNRSKSLRKLLEREEINKGIKFSNQNMGEVDNQITAPLYMMLFI